MMTRVVSSRRPSRLRAVPTGVAVPSTAQLPLPHFRIRQVTTSVIVWDGQTVVLGGLIAENVTKIKDKVPGRGRPAAGWPFLPQ